MFGFIRRYVKRKKFRSKVEVELHDILRNFFDFNGNIYIYLDEYSTERLLDCVEGLKSLHNKYLGKDIQFFHNCEDIQYILYSNIDQLSNIIETDLESREYLYNFLKDYISKRVSLNELDLSREYNKEFFNIFSTIVNIIDDGGIGINYKNFINSYLYSSSILFNEMNDILNEYIKLYPLSNKDIVREKVTVHEPKMIKVSGDYIPTSEFVDYSVLYVKTPKDRYELLSPYSLEDKKYYINEFRKEDDTKKDFNLDNILSIEHFIRNYIKQK
jgi:hypothetical protein